ncbi:DUF397 domain-containing protein [Stackebrandtia nassauensis]|uniref:DUF397 domain-containing protein n=1 Tax=Stackebrandtia nassauensis (strain DSM 44728 / CIP 108903 / NRRL B-16338 / NBRC 102104 / LLR-40K-21) TaxID=446470 RepID=D3QBX7_STANL|nr:protein of unknown function DUF397 [Stackebrandtia nassauensis DSM 44728]
MTGPWRKSSRSGAGNSSQCVETRANWRKSTRSGQGSSSQCLETRAHGPHVDVRDSKTPELGFLSMSASDWDAFLTTVKK